MLIIYRILINLIILLSPIIITYRLIKKKEDPKRFKEKFCVFSNIKKSGKLIWFHGASVGEILSVLPIIDKLEKNKKIKQILVTSNTVSSSTIIKKLKYKKVIHQFFPIDNHLLTNKFLSYWNPSSAFFIDSEIWPNMIYNLKKRKIPITLLNARITKKTFLRWMILKNFSENIFNKIENCFSSNKETVKYLKKLGAQNIKFIGNLKFSQSENKIEDLNKDLKKFINSKKTWCASSTHNTEERFCAIVHKKLKKKYKNFLTIIIPRHIDRADSIKEELKKLNLNVHLHEPTNKINKKTDIYIVNSFGKTKSFYNNCKNVFLGGSLINHGGQNPLEATRYGCNILHGPNVHNFTDIYYLLKKNKISNQVSNYNNTAQILNKLLTKKNYSKQKQQKLKKIGKTIFKKTYKELAF